MTRLVLGTYNIQNTVSPANSERAARTFMGHGVQIGCTQEMPAGIGRLLAADGLGVTKGARVMLFDPAIRLVSQRAPLVAEGRRVGYVPGRRSNLPDYHATVALFDVNGRTVPVINVHTPAHNRWGGGRAAMWRDTEHAVAMLLREQHQRYGVAFAVGDWNRPLPGRRRDFPTLRAIGARSCWDRHQPQPTHGRECIDGVWALGATARAPKVLSKGPSDHHGVVVEYVLG